MRFSRDVALKNQTEQPRVFYAVRDVAKSYRLPLSTVARAYRRLEHEGLLTRVRGSRTLLQGLRYDRRFGIRGLVGLPASLSAFVTVQAYRMFFIKIRRELRLRGFATAMVFFEKDEARSPDAGIRAKRVEGPGPHGRAQRRRLPPLIGSIAWPRRARSPDR